MAALKTEVDPTIFRRSDVRGLYPQQLNLETAKLIGQVWFEWLAKKKRVGNESDGNLTVAIGRDVRVSSGEIFTGLAEGVMAKGGKVIDLDLIGTEVISYASSVLDVDGAAIVSASHNPQQYNGIKFVLRGAVPVAFDSGLNEIKELAIGKRYEGKDEVRGEISRVNILDRWTEYVKGFLSDQKIQPLTVVMDAGNGMGGMLMERLLPYLGIKVTKLFFEPDGDFPNHVPNPLLVENLSEVMAEVKRQQADLGMAFDGDADRVVFIDEEGKPINSSVMGAVIAADELSRRPGATILYNAVCGQVMPESVSREGGKAIRTMVGHSVIKEKMRSTKAAFAVEHSGHFYYRDYFDSDSSMLTVFKVLEIVSGRAVKLSEITKPFDIYYESGEINFETAKKEEIMEELRKRFAKEAKVIDNLDGVSLWFGNWWCNLRPSQNEDLLRLNVEATTAELKERWKIKLVDFILGLGAKIYYPY